MVARELLGCTLRVGAQRVRLVETEAYLGERDMASHARAGRTRRTATMYGPPGTLYVYLIYGLHWLVNVVCAPEGVPHAALLRAAEPLSAGLGRCDGPGRLARSLGVDGGYDGASLLRGEVALEPGPPPARIAVGPRIGVEYAGAWGDAPLRYGDAASGALSRPFRR